jgi:hypothetical protein
MNLDADDLVGALEFAAERHELLIAGLGGGKAEQQVDPSEEELTLVIEEAVCGHVSGPKEHGGVIL